MQLDDYRLLGRSGLRVSPLSLGTMTFGVEGGDTGGGWGTSAADAARMVDLFVDRGGNFIDTANFYAAGRSEEVLAPLIAARRDRIVLSTKYSLTMARGDPNASGNHRKNMVRSVEASLRRLGTDHIDLYYLHMWDGRTPVDEILRAFDDLVRAGKILYAGLSDTPAWQASRMQAIAELRGWSPFVALQIPYNLVERTVEGDLMAMALEMGMGVCPWSPLAGGVLTGKYGRADLAAKAPEVGGVADRKGINLATGRLTERTLTVAEEVKAVAAELGRTPAQVALAWTLRHPAVASPIIGARTPAQLEDNLAALDVTFEDAQARRLDDASRVPRAFPHDLLASPAHDMMFGHVKVARR